MDLELLRKEYLNRLDNLFLKFLCNDLVGKVNIKWSYKFATRGGDATYSKYLIRLGVKVFKIATPEQRNEIVDHEGCHIIAHHLFGDKIRPHGKEWKSLMKACGYTTPQTYHKVDLTSLNLRVKAYCSCTEHQISKFKATRLRRGFYYVCSKCNSSLYLKGQ